MLESANIQRQTGQRPLICKGKALVVGEDRARLACHGAALQRAGWMVVSCGAYTEALTFLRSVAFDLVVLDQGTSAFEGRPVLECALLADRRRPVVVVARCLDMGCYLDAMWLGAADYLEEPVTEMELTRVAETYLDGRSVAA